MRKKILSLVLAAVWCPLFALGMNHSAKTNPQMLGLSTTDSVCLPITSLPYIQDFEGETIGSSTSASFVDCWHRINPASTYFGYPYVSDAASHNFTNGGSRGLYWYSGTGANYGSYQCVVLPPVDTNVIAMDSLQLRFWAKCSYTGVDPVFWIGVMTDPTDISTFQPVEYTYMMDDGEWYEYILTLTEFTGHGQYVAIKANRESTAWTACFDDFVLEPYSTCYPAWDLSPAAVSSSSVTLSWYNPTGSTSWIVEYGPHGFVPGTGMVDTVSTLPCVVGGLMPSTQYDFYVDPTCGYYRGSYHYYTTATTGAVVAATLPFSCGFEDVAQNGNWILENGTYANRWYIGSVANNGGANGLYVSSTGTSLEYSGSSPAVVYAYCEVNVPEAGAYRCSFDWKFQGDGALDYLRAALIPANEVLSASASVPEDMSLYDLPDGWIAADDGAGLRLHNTWQNQSATFYVSNPGNYFLTFVFTCDDIVGIDPSAAVDNVQLIAYECEAPVVSSVATTYYDATVAWNGSGSSYQIAVMPAELEVWPEAVSVNANTYNFTSLSPATSYNFRLRQDCTSDQADYSDWTYGTFVTDSLPCYVPSDIQVDSIFDAGFAISWTANGTETNWEVHVWQVDANEIFATVDTPFYEAVNLLSGTQYYAAVRALCGNDLMAGDWSDTVDIATLQHFAVTLLVNDPAMGEVEGAGSFLAESVARISATPYAGYQFIDWSDGVADAVRNIVVSSDTVLTANFATVQSIDEVGGIVFSVYPNPAMTTTTISVAGMNGRLCISVVDVSGRVVASEVVECAADCEKTMDVCNLEQGTYFVHIVGQNVDCVKKLVIR